jgi:hypothetical protein
MFKYDFSRRKLVKPPKPSKPENRATQSGANLPVSGTPDQSETDPYENTLAGTFLFALGHKLGGAGKPANAFVANFFQQTPMDPFCGDLLAASESGGFLLEFKRNWDGRVKEKES